MPKGAAEAMNQASGWWKDAQMACPPPPEKLLCDGLGGSTPAMRRFEDYESARLFSVTGLSRTPSGAIIDAN
jgi:hypothetical protein